jgi:DNA-binding response OmpR family regulator
MTYTPVLVVSPAPRLGSAPRETLAQAGYPVVEIDDLDSATEVARRTAPRIVVVDASGADEAPLALVARLREDPRTCDIPVLVLRAGKPLRGEDALCELGGVRCLPHPFQVRWLLHEVQYLTTRSTTELVVQRSRRKESVLFEMEASAAREGGRGEPSRRVPLPVELRRSLPVPLGTFQGMG